MADSAPGALVRRLAQAIAWITAKRSRSASILLLALLVGAAALAYGTRIRVDTDLRALLPSSAPSVVALELIEARKGSAEELVVAVESDDDAGNAAMIDALAAEVATWEETKSLTIVRDYTPLRDHALYFLETEQLDDLKQTLDDEHKRAVARAMGPGLDGGPVDVEAVSVGEDWDDPSADNLDWGSPKEEPPPEQDPPPAAEAGKELDLDPFLDEQRERLIARGDLKADEVELIWPRENEAGEIIWEDKLGKPYVNDAGNVRVLKASLSRPATDVEFAQEVVSRIEGAAAAAKAKGIAPDARVEVVAAYDVSKEVDTILRDANRATWISATLIVAVLVIGFRSGRALLLVLVPMAVAMAITLAFAALLFGQLNALTVFLFAVLFGMGVDFAVHLFALRQVQGPVADWPAIVREHLRPLSSTMLTTVGSLAVLSAAEFKAFREFGIISAIGVALCFIAALVLVPALDNLVGPLRKIAIRERGRSIGLHVAPKAVRWVRGVRVALILACLGVGFVGAPKLAFEKDTRALRAASDASKQKINYGSTGGRCAKTLALIADDPAELDLVVDRLIAEKTELLPGAIDTGEERKPWVREIYSLHTLMPQDQVGKHQTIQAIGARASEFLDELDGLDADAKRYRSHLEALERLTKADPLTPAELPEWAVEPFREKDEGSERIAHACLNIAGYHIDELVAVRQRLDELTAGTSVLAADSRLVFADLMVLVERDARELPIWALLVILVFIALDLRRPLPTLICFASLALGLVLTIGLMGMIPLRLNFFNLVVMPAVVGLGIDASIHLWHGRTLTSLGATSRAAMLAALTTIAGFSGLLAAQHLGLRSIGELGILALSICVATAFLVLYPIEAKDEAKPPTSEG